MIYIFYCIGVVSIIYGLSFSYGLIFNRKKKNNYNLEKRKILLGVSEDFSKMVGFPIFFIRFFFLFYSFLIIGIILYVIYYYYLKKNRYKNSDNIKKPKANISKIESHYY